MLSGCLHLKLSNPNAKRGQMNLVGEERGTITPCCFLCERSTGERGAASIWRPNLKVMSDEKMDAAVPETHVSANREASAFPTGVGASGLTAAAFLKVCDPQDAGR